MLKLTAPRNMNRQAMSSMATLSKKPKLASWVEKPPVDTVEKLCAMASKGVMPAAQ